MASSPSPSSASSSPSPSPQNPSPQDPARAPTVGAGPSSARRIPPPCWSLEETLVLIGAYQEKWYSLRRGNLKASNWDDVAGAVQRRCRCLPGITPKTAVQCRHKVEKLRKRYRSEKQRLLRASPDSRSPPSSSWVFYRKMEAMEVGSSPGAPASAAGRRAVPPPPSPTEDELSDDASDEGEDDNYRDDRNFRGVHGLAPNGAGLRFKIPKAVRSKGVGVSRDGRSGVGSGYHHRPNYESRFGRGHPVTTRQGGSAMEETRMRVEKKRNRAREELAADADAGALGETVAAVRMLGDGFMRMEQMKMDMTREIHNLRMEMELKHTEMILDTQRRIVDAFVTGLVGKKRAKMATDS